MHMSKGSRFCLDQAVVDSVLVMEELTKIDCPIGAVDADCMWIVTLKAFHFARTVGPTCLYITVV